MIKNEIKFGSFTQNESKDYSDILDREISREFLYTYKQKSHLKFGDKYQLDLLGYDNKSGCDVEFLTFNATDSFKRGGFRIPKRKEHYWNGSELRDGKNGKWRNQYQNYLVEYIQLFDDRKKLLFYNPTIIKKYIDNITYLNTQGWEEKNKYFINLPYDMAKNDVQYYIRNEYGGWELQTL